MDILVEDEGIGRDAVHEKDVCADGAPRADDCFTTDDRCAGVNGDMVLEGGMAFLTAQLLTSGEGSGDQADALVHFHVVADEGGFTDDGAGAMINEEMGPDSGARMQIHSGAAVGPFGHDSGDEGDFAQVQLMSHSLDGDGFDEGVRDDDFLLAEGGGIAVVSGFGVGLKQFSDAGQFGEEIEGQIMGSGPKVLFAELNGGVVFEAFVDFIFKPALDGVHKVRCLHFDLGRMNRFFVEEPGKKEFQQILSNQGDGAFGGKIDAVEVIDSADPGVGGDQLVGQRGHRIFHEVSIAEGQLDGKRRGE